AFRGPLGDEQEIRKRHAGYPVALARAEVDVRQDAAPIVDTHGRVGRPSGEDGRGDAEILEHLEAARLKALAARRDGERLRLLDDPTAKAVAPQDDGEGEARGAGAGDEDVRALYLGGHGFLLSLRFASQRASASGSCSSRKVKKSRASSRLG